MTKRPRQFDDPAIDTLLGIAISMGAEVYALRDRMRIIEMMLETTGTISRAEIEAYKPAPEEEKEIRKDNDAFMARLFRVFEGDLE